ncbi:GNAT family N-acetyltransferase [Bermanella marisrubri]|uniref:Acetyltransferase, GNAT family protein n=1 Tax=Bermanella marisrubri TaxID=207949 RepID=Q1N355_9GAMM|nr:GNAT family N-acetyltransferase [Bermanella marisrubri]EAT12736.1 acetyltransferase, GNAT family protein [Oceanobacter sp. RED65] [Bermanella marisrubri]QIZ85146.1 GNAT family N-acetyltransferase [Bermanella marisrubri]
MPNIQCIIADYQNPQHGSDLVFLLNSYALDPMGGGEPLNKDVQEGLPHALAQRPHAMSILCYVDDQPAGLINTFEGFSTFKCKPLINIHDVVVHKDFRGLKLSQVMLDYLENIAREKGCCKLTLEVIEGNKVAQNAYNKFGFSGYEMDPQFGQAMFWEKAL